MWRQYDVAFLSTFILLLFLRIYQNLSTDFPILFLLNITTRGVRHHSPLTTSLSLLFVRWTREGLLTRRSVHYLIWIVVPSSLDPFSLAISPVNPDRHCSVLTFRLVILLIDSDRHCSVQTFRLVILLIDSDRHCSVLTFRLVILLIDSDRHCSVQTFRLVILLIDSNQHCSVQALACTRNL